MARTRNFSTKKVPKSPKIHCAVKENDEMQIQQNINAC